MTVRQVAVVASLLSLVLALGGCLWWGGEAKDRPPAAGPRDLRIDVQSNSMIAVQGLRMPLATLENHLRQVAAEIGFSGIRVIVSPSEDAPYAVVAQVIDAARRAGFKDVYLSPQPTAQPPDKP